MKTMMSKSTKPRIIAISIVVIFITVAGLGIWWYLLNSKSSNNDATTTPTNTKELPLATDSLSQPALIHMAAMGDMLAHDTIIANAKSDNNYDFGKYFANIRSSYGAADVVFCNQEGSSAGSEYGISGYPSFNAPTEFSSGLFSGAGCNLINLANNHMDDKGSAAVVATINVWDNLKPLAFAGANKTANDQNTVSYTTVNNIKISFLAFTDFNNNGNTPSYSVNNYHDEALVRRLVAEARLNSDVIIVSMHWGVEDSNTVSSDQINQAKLLSSLGVDVIIGTGPHVLQKVDTLIREDGGKTIVWYSLGNMLSSQFYIAELIGGIAQFDISKSDSGVITIDNLTFVPTYMHYEWTAAQQANSDLLARKNAMIYLLDLSEGPLLRSLLNTTVKVQKQYVIDTLGSKVTVK